MALTRKSPAGNVVSGVGGPNLSNRISLPVPLSQNYDALVTDGVDNIFVAITNTGNGIAVVDVTSIPEPSLLAFESRPHHPAPGAGQGKNVGPRKAQKGLPAIRAVPYATRQLLHSPESWGKMSSSQK